MLKLSSWLAIVVGAGVAVAQIYRNYDNMERWMMWGVDVFAGAVMIVSGLLALRKQTTRMLPVGWSFSLGLYASALLTHLTYMRSAEGERYAGELQLVGILAVLVAVAIAGLGMVMFSPKAKTA